MKLDPKDNFDIPEEDGLMPVIDARGQESDLHLVDHARIKQVKAVFANSQDEEVRTLGLLYNDRITDTQHFMLITHEAVMELIESGLEMIGVDEQTRVRILAAAALSILGNALSPAKEDADE